MARFMNQYGHHLSDRKRQNEMEHQELGGGGPHRFWWEKAQESAPPAIPGFHWQSFPAHITFSVPNLRDIDRRKGELR
jgi:hypothetical protein